ncbi:hypothetical protein HQQ88_08450 [Curtobacterium sp. VKM Ac-2861]|uniref:hypothetical protein n=1 Tax=Curtobacterium sp. VKM Ac-2861 TaxID=2739016 RepID=UPI001565914D|nr:hypothetical protein [Curtobacterium sp. VKM Ac-2861]
MQNNVNSHSSGPHLKASKSAPVTDRLKRRPGTDLTGRLDVMKTDLASVTAAIPKDGSSLPPWVVVLFVVVIVGVALTLFLRRKR